MEKENAKLLVYGSALSLAALYAYKNWKPDLKEQIRFKNNVKFNM